MTGRYKSYPEYKESGIEWLKQMPSHWNKMKAKHIFKRMQRPTRSQDGVVTAFRDGEVTLRSNRRTDGFTNSTKEIGYQGVRKGDLLVHAMDGFAGAIGVSDSDGKCSPVCSVCIPWSSDAIVTKYYGYLVRQLAVTDYITSLAKGIRERSTEFRFNEFSNLFLAVPPTEEQKKIVDFLEQEISKINLLIAKQELLVKLLQEKRWGLVSEAVNSSDVQAYRIGHVTEQMLREYQHIQDQEVITLGLYNRGRGIFEKEPKLSQDLGDSDFYYVEEGDLILSGQFAWEGSIAIADDIHCNSLVSHRYPVLRGKQGTLDTNFLWAYLTTKEGHFILNENSVGSAGRNRPLNIRTLLKEKIFIPSLEQQSKVAKFVKVEKRINEKIKEQIIQLNERKVALISAVVTGKIDVRDWGSK
ncbi:restriction endonuclease subunit S [Vibrio natriegens]|uniref:restriction endonuclease subunit S n=1 Tax=Vibrio natriegens TaxID=691 RepID=UPI0021E7835E|nr:restriction endonuclease subunit S [Vibrio natriegens]UYI50191.1 restriction endonuclease subunit S [Vibrio natriegens]